MTLKERIENDYKTAFKTGQHEVVAVLRYLKAQVKNAEIARRKDFDDNEVLEIVIQDAKRHQDSIGQFQKGGRPELANNEQAQLAVLKHYLPDQLSEAELRDIAQELIAHAGAREAKEFGKVMGLMMAKVRGQADGKLVQKIITEELAKKKT